MDFLTHNFEKHVCVASLCCEYKTRSHRPGHKTLSGKTGIGASIGLPPEMPKKINANGRECEVWN